MSTIGLHLNLANHKGPTGLDTSLAADVEGHLGSDDRLYIIDLSRIFPPVPTDPAAYPYVFHPPSLSYTP
jgi:hypothetical protein